MSKICQITGNESHDWQQCFTLKEKNKKNL